jgi:hypothetical protein
MSDCVSCGVDATEVPTQAAVVREARVDGSGYRVISDAGLGGMG